MHSVWGVSGVCVHALHIGNRQFDSTYTTTLTLHDDVGIRWIDGDSVSSLCVHNAAAAKILEGYIYSGA